MGYGDLFVAGVFGGVLAREGRSQGLPALLTLFVAGLFDLLFFVLSELPATVPVALTMVALEARRWHTGEERRRGAGVRPGRRACVDVGAGAPDAPQWGVSLPVEAGGATPRPAR